MSWKKWLVGLAAVVCLSGWVAVALAAVLGAEAGPRLAAVALAVVATEALFWAAALTLGVSVFEARRKIWRRVTGRA